MMRRTTIREIRQSRGRYLAILAIIALGVGFFAGLRLTTTAMLATGSTYLSEHHLYDYRLLSTLGFEQEDVEALAGEKGITAVSGSVNQDVIYVDETGEEGALGAYSITQGINTLRVVEGRMPQKDDECVIDASLQTIPIGGRVRISDNNTDETKERFAYSSYTVVGRVNSPIYLNFERGSTSLLSGKLDGFVYLMPDGFACDYYTEIYLLLDHNLAAYSKEYEDLLDAQKDRMETLCKQQGYARYDRIIQDAAKELDEAKTELSDKEQEAREELDKAAKELDDVAKELEDAKAELDRNEKKLRSSKAQILDGLAKVRDGKAQMEMMFLTFGPQWEALAAKEKELSASLSSVNEGLKQIKEKREEADEGEQELADGRAEYEKSKADFEKEIAKAHEKLSDAQKELDKIEKPDCFALSRMTNVGYACFENDVNIVAGVSLVFPVFFFLVAALVCSTTMNRMIEEQRTQIGVLKALGYGKAAIMGKYLFYSGSAALIGGVGGFFAGSYVFPLVIWEAYKLMYDFCDTLVYVFDLPLFVLSLLAALLCSAGATYASCYYELSGVAAALIRPKAPKNGKRIFLEQFGFLWNRLKFLHKVSIRNVVRYKKRFFMMILGISGCSALLVTGFGIKDSMKYVMAKQYEKIQLYDLSVTFDEDMTRADRTDFETQVKDFVSSYLMVSEESVDIEAGGQVRSVTLIVPEKEDTFGDFISLHTKKGEPIDFPKDGEIVLTQKTADKLGVKPGDVVTVRDTDRRHMELTLKSVADNYVYNYAFVGSGTYQKGWKKELTFTNGLVSLTDADSYDESNAAISDLSYVLSSGANKTFQARFDNMLKSLDAIVVLVIFSAGALAFIVLYNLTNINITERIREIATIKVLGFYPGETASYVFRENMLLTVLGGLLGLALGILLHRYVMYNIDLDIVMFDKYIAPVSFGYSIGLTFAFAMLVNGLMYLKLQKINMAESLKSIE